jgi:DNA-nicking Smr family endonuclease
MAGKTDDDFLKHLGLAKPTFTPKTTPPKEPTSSKKIAARQPKPGDIDFKEALKGYLGAGQLLGAQKLREEDSVKKAPSPFKEPTLFRAQVTLDLHGLIVEKALGQLHWTIDGMERKKQTLLRVISGKGLHSKEGPVLKKAVHHFLQNDSRIKRFEEAPGKLGGSGAYLVELKSEI